MGSNRRAQDRERAAAEAAAKAKRAEAERKTVAEAQKIVAIWNARQAGGRALWFYPGIPAISACSGLGCRELTKNLRKCFRTTQRFGRGTVKASARQSLRSMAEFDYVVALKIFAAGSLVYGAVLFILIRFQ